MWQWRIKRQAPLPAINGSSSLLWRKDCSLIFRADTGKMEKKGSLYFLIVSSFLLVNQRVALGRSHTDSVLQLTPGTAELLPSALLTSFQPAQKPPQMALGGTSGLALARSGEKVVEMRKGNLRSIDRSWASSAYPAYKPSSWVKSTEIQVCWCLVHVFLAHGVKPTVKWIYSCSFSIPFGRQLLLIFSV